MPPRVTEPNESEMSDAPAMGSASPAQAVHSTHSSPKVAKEDSMNGLHDGLAPNQAAVADKPADAAPAPASTSAAPPPMTDAQNSQAEGITAGHHLLHKPVENNGSDDLERATTVAGSSNNIGGGDGGGSPTEVPNSIAFRLYTSHFLSTWNSRLFEFGAALFLTSIFPGTLLPVSVYSLVRNAGYIIFAQPLGAWINKGNRLNIIRTSIVAQRLPVAASCALLLVLELKGGTLGYRRDDGIFAVIVLLAVVEKLASTMNTISVERDWVSRNVREGFVLCRG